MKLYETTFITDSKLEEAETEKEIKKIENLITEKGGEIVEIQRWGLRRLAYEINKKRQGYYTHFLYKAVPSIPAILEGSFKINERVMRHLTVVSEIDLEKRAAEEAAEENAKSDTSEKEKH